MDKDTNIKFTIYDEKNNEMKCSCGKDSIGGTWGRRSYLLYCESCKDKVLGDDESTNNTLDLILKE